MLRLAYTLLIALASVPASVLLWLHDRGHPQGAWRWRERFGFIAGSAVPVDVWVHAASVGEVLAAAPLVNALLARHGDGRIAVSCFTATGSEQIRRLWGARVRHAYLPFDLPGAVARFLDRLAPRKAIIVETELWPNLYHALARRGVPIVIANARLSERSVRGYARVPSLIHDTLSRCTLVAARTELDAERFRTLGAAAVAQIGNIKLDVSVPDEQLQAGAALRERLGDARPVWVAASTHEGEEAAALAAHRRLLATHSDALLIVVPRHPQRFDNCWKLLQASGLRVARRQLDDADTRTQILLGDSMGEMFVYLAAADIAFVGGSLVDIGGHNILEPAAIGRPVLFGPRMQNFADARALLLDSSGAIEVADGAALGEALQRLFDDRALLATTGSRGRDAVNGARGALRRLLDALDGIPPAGDR